MISSVTIDFGKRLLRILRKRNMSVAYFSDLTGLSRTALFSYIHGKNSPSLEKLAIIKDALDVSWRDLLGET